MTNGSATPATRPVRTPRRRRPPPRTLLLMAARRVHFLAGIAVAPFVFLLAATGLGHTVAPLLDDLIHPTALFVDEVGAQALPVSEQVSAALIEHRGARVTSVTVPGDPDRTTRVALDVLGVPLSVYVDPYTAVVRGTLESTGTPTREWLAEAHRSLHLGEPGRLYAEFAVSWLPIIVLFGVFLRVSQRRRSGARAWHGALGLALAAALLLIGFSGVQRTVLAGERVSAVLSTAPPRLHAPPVTPAPARVGVDDVVALARSAGLSGALTVVPPERGDRPYEVAESGGGPSQVDKVAVDPYLGRVTAAVGWADYSATAKARAVATAFHHGLLFGWANRLVLAGVALGTIALLALGYRMWWARREAPPPVWRYLSTRARTLLIVGTAGVCWLLPVLGASLVAFAAVDRLARRRSR
ncbi:PepSY-associated TM helix domain-containing protein [Actinokineospora fastidiosa]|nr:PepSY domain-containing protein [Actinokineospora fastidiosa]